MLQDANDGLICEACKYETTAHGICALLQPSFCSIVTRSLSQPLSYEAALHDYRVLRFWEVVEMSFRVEVVATMVLVESERSLGNRNEQDY